MKKITLLIVTVLISLNLFAQKIYYDKQDENNRTIITYYEPFMKGKGLAGAVFKMNLTFCQLDDEEMYYITIPIIAYDTYDFPAGSRLLLKLSDGTNVELVTETEFSRINCELISTPYGYRSMWYHFPKYSVSPEDMTLLLSQNEITKIRIEVPWGDGYFDLPTKNYKKWHLSAHLQSSVFD